MGLVMVWEYNKNPESPRAFRVLCLSNTLDAKKNTISQYASNYSISFNKKGKITKAIIHGLDISKPFLIAYTTLGSLIL